MKILPILSIHQPSLNQCLISKKYYSEAVPEIAHLSIPPGFLTQEYNNEIYYQPEISSSLSSDLINKLVNNVSPNAKIEIMYETTPLEDKKKYKKTKKKGKSSPKSKKQTKKK